MYQKHSLCKGEGFFQFIHILVVLSTCLLVVSNVSLIVERDEEGGRGLQTAKSQTWEGYEGRPVQELNTL